MLIQDVPFLRIFNQKTYVSYIQICNKSQTFRNKLKHVRLKIDAVEQYYEQKTYSRGIFYYTCNSFYFLKGFFQISQGSTVHGILRKQQVPHPMETIKVEHSREIQSKTTAWAENTSHRTHSVGPSPNPYTKIHRRHGTPDAP